MAAGYIDETGDVLRLTDFRLAGFLVARGVKFLGSDMNGKNEVVFRFENINGTTKATLGQYQGSPEETYDLSCRKMHDIVRSVLSVDKPRTGRR